MEERIEPKVGVVIVAGGSGRRAGGVVPKQFQFLGNLPILARTINLFSEALPAAQLVVVLAEDRVDYWRDLSARFDLSKHSVVAGGAARFDSVKAGLAALSDVVDLIAVHDGARPLATVAMVRRCVESATSNGSAIPVVAVSDSLREVAEDGSSRQVDRSSIRSVQTPQVFDAATLRRAYAEVCCGGGFTDDASVVESLGERVWLCDGERRNIKITTREDIVLARQILEEDQGGE